MGAKHAPVRPEVVDQRRADQASRDPAAGQAIARPSSFRLFFERNEPEATYGDGLRRPQSELDGQRGGRVVERWGQDSRQAAVPAGNEGDGAFLSAYSQMPRRVLISSYLRAFRST